MLTLILVLVSVYLVLHFGFVNIIEAIRGQSVPGFNLLALFVPATYLLYHFWLRYYM
jgi:hypothetical protein